MFTLMSVAKVATLKENVRYEINKPPPNFPP
jgi:hypothetical protein